MPNELSSVVVDPTEVKSGGTVTVRVKYNAVSNGNLEISCSGSFAVEPTAVPLSTAASSTSFDLKVTRTSATAPHECILHFNFAGDDRDHIVEVH
jgi:hypothetical protein